MKIVFMGTPQFAVPSLKALIDKHDVMAVLTQPDRPKGRGKKLMMSPVKEVALEHNIEVYQPLKLRTDSELIEKIKDLKPDFIIVVAFGQILSKEVLDIPKYGCINLHASLLPKYRGAAPINWSIINGEKVTGNTTMLMDVGLDTGDMLLKNEVEITPNMTAVELHDALMESGAPLLLETIDKMVEGKINPIKQNEEETCYASMLSKEIAKIDWNKDAKEIHNLIRGINSWTAAHSNYEDKVMKVYESEVISGKYQGENGQIIKVSKDGILVKCGKENLLIKKIQFPNMKPLYVKDYINGHEIEEKLVLG